MQTVKLEQILNELGWSKAELARRVNIHPGTISRWKEVPGPVAAYLSLYRDLRELLENS